MSEQSRYHGGTKRERCYLCDSRGPIQEHHIVPQRLGGSDNRENIVEVCQLCHQRLERLYGPRFYKSLGIDDPKTQEGTHIPCEADACTEAATHKHYLSGVGQDTVVCRCPDHPPKYAEQTITL